MKRPTVYAIVVVLGVSVSAAAPPAAVAERPVTLVTSNLIMHGGKPFVALADLARATGGVLRVDPGGRLFELQPGANGALTVNPGALGGFANARRAVLGRQRLARPAGGGGQTGHLQLGAQASVKVKIGGEDVMLDDYEYVLLRPGEGAISLEVLARLLGGSARFDPGTGAWKLPPGDPGSPLKFR